MKMSKAEKLIAKIVDVNDFGVGKGIAEGTEWKVYRTSHPQTDTIKMGQYVVCYVLHDEDNDEFYLCRLDTDHSSTEEEWLNQETRLVKK
jgi:hypothetical protein